MLAIIPARGGSKGVPDKNIRQLGGQPLISYTIEAALRSERVSNVVVSTDSDNIAKIAKDAGANVPFMRPDYLATDQAIAIDAYLHCIDFMTELNGKEVEDLVVLLPTTPLRRSEDIDRAIDLYKEKDADSVISFTHEDHPIQWHKFLNDDLSLVNVFDEPIKNRQEYRPSYYPNGSIYVFKSALLRKREYYSDKSYAYLMPKLFSVDIDNELDFKWAEFLIENKIYEDSSTT